VKNIIFILLSILFLLSSCNYFQLKTTADSKEEVVARLGKEHLYKKDLVGLYKSDISKEDSLRITANFIESWAQKQILLQKAALNLPEEQETAFSKLITDYKNDLYINYYKEAVLAQNFDTIINTQTLTSFYEKNQNAFRLNEELVQYKYISYVTSTLNDSEIKRLFVKNDVESTNALLEDELKFVSLQLNDSTWTSYSDIVKHTPVLQSKDKNSMLRDNYFFKLKDSVNTHLFYVKKVLKRNEIAPLKHVYPVVKQMILHKNKLKYLKDIETKLMEDAIQNNTYEKY